jgi:nucleoside-diphosphate-sugar epimerase
MKVLVLGASGFIGRNLVTKLLSKGYQVRVLTRSHKKKFPKEVEVVFGDLTNSDLGTCSLVHDCEVVFNCAGELNDKSKMWDVHVEGTERLINSFASNNIYSNKHWVQLSSVGAYGPPLIANLPRVVTEQTANNPIGEYEYTKTKADDFIIDFSQILGVTYSILRPSNVVGPEMPNQSFFGLITSIAEGRFFYINSRKSFLNYIHVDDVVNALILCGFHKQAKNEIFNLSNDCGLNVMVESVLQLYSKKDNFLCLPEGMVRVAIKILSVLFKLPLTDKRVDALVSKTRYCCDKIETKLDFQVSVDIPSFAQSELINSK